MAKRYLKVAYKDKDLAKRLGAKWDPSVNQWYCLEHSPLAKVLSWRSAPKKSKSNAALSQENIAHERAEQGERPHNIAAHSAAILNAKPSRGFEQMALFA